MEQALAEDNGVYPVRPRSPARRWLRAGLLAAVVLTALWLLASLAAAYRFTRRPHALYPESSPSLAWGRVESRRLTTRDGQEIGAWFLDGRRENPSILLLHPNGGCRGTCLPQAEMLAAEGYPVLMITHRAHGDSTGEVNDFGYSARHDVVAAVEWLEQRRPGRPVVVFGISLGAAAAAYASGELGERVSGYILEGPHRDLRTAVRNRTTIYLPPVVDRVANTGLSLVAPLVLPEVNRMSPLDAVGGVPAGVPVLILAGGADRHARPEEARALYERVRSHGRLVLFPGAAHARLLRTDPELYRRLVLTFVGQCRTSAAHVAGSHETAGQRPG
jgi:alpha-beta hydrolase superfamily lysophospholipase